MAAMPSKHCVYHVALFSDSCMYLVSSCRGSFLSSPSYSLPLSPSFPPLLLRFLIDVTVRSPFARGLGDVAGAPGAAANAGERDKASRYGPAVVPFAVEQLGRLGGAARQVLAALHRESCEYGRLRPGTGRTAPLSLRAARADIEAAVVLTSAQTAILALGGSSLPALGWVAGERGRAARPDGAGPVGGGEEVRGGAGRGGGRVVRGGRGR